MNNISSLETINSRIIKFILLTICEVFSICCFIYVLFHLIVKPTFRQALHNHAIIALVIVGFFHNISDLPMLLDYLRKGKASSSMFCLLWNFFAFSNYAVGAWIMVWLSFERHFVVFHNYLINTFRTQIYFHYIPLFTCIGTPLIYYIFLVFFYPCRNLFDETILFCGYCCYAKNDRLVLFNWLAFGIIPIFLITIFNLSLIVRVIIQKHRLQQQFNWNQFRLMIIQLLSISCFYLLFEIPIVIVGIIQIFMPKFAIDIQLLYLYYIIHLLPLLIPLMYFGSFRELSMKKRKKFSQSILLRDTRSSKRDETFKRTIDIVETQPIIIQR